MNLIRLFYLIFATTLVVILTSCSSTSKKTTGDVVEDKLGTNQEHHLRSKELTEKMLNAKNRQGWSEYVAIANQLWTLTETKDQLTIEQEVWQTLKAIEPNAMHALRTDQTNSIELNDWLEFVEITQLQPLLQKQALIDSQTFNPSAMFNAHLNDWLQQRLNNFEQVKHVAVLLPFSGNFQKISLQIRNGIIKNKLTNLPDLTLSFYDTSNPNLAEQLYYDAIENGADFVIGPIQKEAIQALEQAGIEDHKIITLNKANILPSFNYHTTTEANQISNKLYSEQYKHIAILASSTGSDSRLGLEIAELWQQFHGKQVTLKNYPAKKPDLRVALASITNEKLSQERNNNLRWMFGQKLFFEPRIRQDLDAIVMLGNSRQIAVFKPQLQFFSLNLPVYASSKLTPTKLYQAKPVKDLANTIFPSFAAALKPTELNSKFEAFGWDSLILASKQHLLGANICLNEGMTGRLSKNGLLYDRQLIWAKYNRRGVAEVLKD